VTCATPEGQELRADGGVGFCGSRGGRLPLQRDNISPTPDRRPTNIQGRAGRGGGVVTTTSPVQSSDVSRTRVLMYEDGPSGTPLVTVRLCLVCTKYTHAQWLLLLLLGDDGRKRADRELNGGMGTEWDGAGDGWWVGCVGPVASDFDLSDHTTCKYDG